MITTTKYCEVPKFEVGQDVELLVNNDPRHKRIFKGEVFQVTDNAVFLKNETYKESFMMKDFKCGRVRRME